MSFSKMDFKQWKMGRPLLCRVWKIRWEKTISKSLSISVLNILLIWIFQSKGKFFLQILMLIVIFYSEELFVNIEMEWWTSLQLEETAAETKEMNLKNMTRNTTLEPILLLHSKKNWKVLTSHTKLADRYLLTSSQQAGTNLSVSNMLRKNMMKFTSLEISAIRAETTMKFMKIKGLLGMKLEVQPTQLEFLRKLSYSENLRYLDR